MVMNNKFIITLLIGTMFFTLGGCYTTPSNCNNRSVKEEKVSISTEDISFMPIAGEHQSIQVVTFDKQELQDYEVINNDDGSKDVILHINK